VTDTIAIIGMGNSEMGDDGIGVLLVEKLREELESGAWKPGTARLVECSIAGRDAVLAGACLMEASAALLVDAADMGAKAGDSRLFSPGEAVFGADASAACSHTLGLSRMLEMVRGLGAAENVRIMGVQPERIVSGAGLSDRLNSRLAEMIDKIKEEVSRLP
jgi:hydrogenase maturation protease